MITSQMGVTSDPQDLWRMGMMVGCDGTLEEDGEAERAQKRKEALK